MFEAYAFQILRLLTKCLTRCLAVFYTDIDRPGPSTAPKKLAHIYPTVSTVQF